MAESISMNKQLQIYKSLIDEINAKIKKSGPLSLSEEELAKVRIASSALIYARSIALREVVIQSIKGNKSLIEEYINKKKDEISKEIEVLEKEKEKLASQITSELEENGYDVKAVRGKKVQRLETIIDNIKAKTELKQRVGEALLDSDYLLAQLISEDKRPDFIMKGVIKTFEESLPLQIAASAVQSQSSDVVKLIGKNEEELSYINEDGTINRQLVDLALSALGDGDLYTRLQKVELLKRKEELYGKVLSFIDRIPGEIKYLSEFNEIVLALEEKAENIRKQIPTGLTGFVKSDVREEGKYKLSKINDKLEPLKEKQAKLTRSFTFQLSLFNSLTDIDFDKELTRKVSKTDMSKLTPSNSDEISTLFSKEKIESYKAQIEKKKEEAFLERRKVNVGIARDHRDMDTEPVVHLTFKSYQNGSKIDENLENQKRQLRDALKLLQMVDNLAKRRLKVKELISEEQQEDIRNAADRKIADIIFNDNTFGMKM